MDKNVDEIQFLKDTIKDLERQLNELGTKSEEKLERHAKHWPLFSGRNSSYISYISEPSIH